MVSCELSKEICQPSGEGVHVFQTAGKKDKARTKVTALRGKKKKKKKDFVSWICHFFKY